MKKIVIGILVAIVVVAAVSYYLFWTALINDPFVTVYDDTCAGCHGEDMLGADDAREWEETGGAGIL